MAHTYTPGLKVIPRTVVRRDRILPLAGQVLVESGTEVQTETIVARAELPGDVALVNAVNKLGCSAAELPGLMLVQVGSPVNPGDILAETRPWLSILKTQLTSPVVGTVETISPVTGQIILRGPSKPVEIAAYLDGKIVEVLPQQGVVVETIGTFVQGIFGIGGETSGPLEMVCRSPDQELTRDLLNPAHKGKIIVGGSFISGETLRHAASLGVAAIVVGGFHDHDLRALLGYDLGVAITGHEEVGLTLVMTEGFGRIPMRQHTFDLLKSRQGARTAVNGATQIRAGVLRPEIIIPWPDRAAAAAEEAVRDPGLVVGSKVRIIRQPYFGKLGAVSSLPVEPQTIPTGAQARVAEITLADQTRVLVPRANLEMIEE